MESEKDLFWKVLEPEYRAAMLFCRKLMGDRDRGDDLFQDALVIACQKFGDLRQPGAFRAWLYRVIITTFQSTVRRPWWRRVVPLTDEAAATLSTPDPTSALSARRWLNLAFQSIKPDDQALIVLHELHGWPLKELARMHGLSEGAIKLRLHRARNKVREALGRNLKRYEKSRTRKAERNEANRCIATKSGIE